MAGIDDILEQCVQQVQSGRSTLDDCLAQNPQHAHVLRPLLQTALQIGELDRPQGSRAGFRAGEQLMMDTLAREQAKRELSPSPKRDFFRSWSFFRRGTRPGGVTLTRLATVSVIAAATLLVWVAAAGLLLRMWNETLLPQTCLVADASGITQVQTGRDAAWQLLTTGWALEPGHRIRTGDPASVTVRFPGGGSTSVGPNSELEIVQLGVRRDGNGEVVVLQQAAGSTHTMVERLADSTTLFEIDTAGASVVAHGTEFKVLVSPDGSTSAIVLEGAVAVTGRETTVTLTAGQEVVVGLDQAPGPVVLAAPEDLVESPSPEASPEGYHGASATPEMPTMTTTLGAASHAPTARPPSPTPTSRPPVPTASPTPATPTTIPTPFSPTATHEPSPPTATHEPSPPTATPRPPTPTGTPEPPSPTPTSVPSPTLEAVEIVEVLYAVYAEDKQELWVKARTNIAGCALTLEGFGPMEPEGDHWVYVEESLEVGAVPPTVTARSSCGGSGSSAVRWR
jgi:hypothetical protein